MFALIKRLKKFFGYFFLFDFASANGCREADKKRGGYFAKEKSVTKGKLSSNTKTL